MRIPRSIIVLTLPLLFIWGKDVFAQDKPKRARIFVANYDSLNKYELVVERQYYTNASGELDSVVDIREKLRRVYTDFSLESNGEGFYPWNTKKKARTMVQYFRNQSNSVQNIFNGKIDIRTPRFRQVLSINRHGSRLIVYEKVLERYDKRGFQIFESSQRDQKYVCQFDSLGRMVSRTALQIWNPQNRQRNFEYWMDTITHCTYNWSGDTIIELSEKEYGLEVDFVTRYTDLVWVDSVVEELMPKIETPARWLAPKRHLIGCKFSTRDSHDIVDEGGFTIQLDNRLRPVRYVKSDSSYTTYAYYDEDNAVKLMEFYKMDSGTYQKRYAERLDRTFDNKGRLVRVEFFIYGMWIGEDFWRPEERIDFEY